MKVADVMSTDLVTVTPQTSLKDAATRMLQTGVSGLPVVDGEGRLVGIVTEADFVDQEASHDWAARFRLLDPLFGRGPEALRDAHVVADVMTEALVTVEPTTRVARAARLMVERGVKRLPVVDDGGRLVGIVSRADVMRAIARADEDIAGDIAELLERRLLPIDPEDVGVTVAAGIVTLRGEVEARVDALVLADVVSRMDGVVRVDSELDWEVDTRIPEQRFPGYSQEGKEE